jgi:hypothetical protein
VSLRLLVPVVVLAAAGCGSSGSGATVPVNAADASSGGGNVGGSGTGGSPTGGSSNGGSSNGGQGTGGLGDGGSAAGGNGGVPAEGSVSCDPRAVRCRVATPTCTGVMEVPSVVGTCYGPCVPIAACKCSSAVECPDSNQYTCIMSAKHCSPYLQ